MFMSAPAAEAPAINMEAPAAAVGAAEAAEREMDEVAMAAEVPPPLDELPEPLVGARDLRAEPTAEEAEPPLLEALGTARHEAVVDGGLLRDK